jgi:hypothetical protein
MGSNHSKNKINYEDVQDACKNAFNKNNNGKKYAIINTMDKTRQSCLIQSTIPIQEEEEMINGILNNKYSNSNSNSLPNGEYSYYLSSSTNSSSSPSPGTIHLKNNNFLKKRNRDQDA